MPDSWKASVAVERERRFHNERFSEPIDPRSHLGKWYGAIRHGAKEQERIVRALAKNRRVLEYGCSDGALSLAELRLPEVSESLTGIDISDVAIRKAAGLAAQLGYANARFLTMNAEAMTFPDNSFDLVFGRGIIHHLDLGKCYSEVARVLRSKGVAVFFEPMGHNPILNLYRKRTPSMRTADEHPLLMRDFALARRHFARVETAFYGLFTVAGVLLGPVASGIAYRLSKTADDFILKIPGLRRYAWYCLMVCYKE